MKKISSAENKKANKTKTTTTKTTMKNYKYWLTVM